MPMLAGSLLQTAYSLINAFWVGKFLGTKALAAVTVSLPSVFVLISVAAGLTLATNILIAQYVGAHDYPPVKATVQTSVLLIGGSGLVFLLLGQVLASRLLHIIETPPDVLPTALPYLRIFLCTMPLSFGIFLIGSMLRGIGDSQTPVYFQSASVVLNAALDPVLMFGLVGFPKLGLNGTAWATLIAQICALIGLMIYVPARRPLVAPDWRRLRIDGSIALLLAKIGFPAMIQQSVVSVSLVVIVKFVSRFGTNADAAFGAAVRIDQVSFLPALIIGAAISTLAGQNIGARQYHRVQQVFRWGVVLSGAISAVISALVLTFPGLFVRMFVSDARVIAIGVGYLRIVGITYLLYAVLFAANGVINGAGHTSWTTAFSVVGLWGVRLPLAYTLANHLHSVKGIWWGMLISVGVSMVLSLIYYAVGGWKRPILRGLTAAAAQTEGTESDGGG
jgi:putative MATE family efflux protein